MPPKAQRDGALLEFYGTECPHCIQMAPLVDRLETELGAKVQKYEVWHNEENARLMEKYDRGFCGGVPFFYNQESKQWVCGGVSYEQLKAWAQGRWGHGRG